MGDGRRHRPLDHRACDHMRDMDDLCASLYLLQRWPKGLADSQLRHRTGPTRWFTGRRSLGSQLTELNELARKRLGG